MLQLNFSKIKLHNFGSYADSELDLEKKGFCLVSGKNLCPTDNAESNGSGKSFIWSGICYALTGETIQGLHAGLKNINIADNDMWVELYFNADGNDYVIKRGSNPSKSLYIEKNGTDMSGKTFTESAAKFTEEFKEITRDLIASTIIIGQGMPNKFSSFSPSGRKELLEKLTKADYMIEDVKKRIAERAKELDGQAKAIDEALIIANTNMNTQLGIAESCRKTLAESVKPDFDAIIAGAKTQIASIDKDLAEAQAAAKTLDEQIMKASEELTTLSGSKSNKLTELNEKYNAKRTPLVNKAAELNAEIKSAEREITRIKNIKDICPTCGHKLEGVEKPDTTELEAAVKAKTAELATVNGELNEALSKYNAFKTTLDESFNAGIASKNAEVSELRKNLSKLRDDIADFTHYKQVETEKLTKATYDRDNYDNWVRGFEASIKAAEDEATKFSGEITMLSERKATLAEHIAVIRKMDTLSKRDFRGFLLENIIAYIDKKAKDYCETVFKTRALSIYLDGNSLDISYNGKMIDNLSGGEKTRVDLILQLTIRNLLQNYLGFNSNILVLDEITDFLDKTSCKAVMSLLEKELTTIESVFVISHHASELELPIDSEIKVIKSEQGISAIN